MPGLLCLAWHILDLSGVYPTEAEPCTEECVVSQWPVISEYSFTATHLWLDCEPSSSQDCFAIELQVWVLENEVDMSPCAVLSSNLGVVS